MKLKDLKKHEYFKFVDKNGNLSKTVYVRDYYNRSYKKYYVYHFENVNIGKLYNGNKKVTTNFEF